MLIMWNPYLFASLQSRPAAWSTGYRQDDAMPCSRSEACHQADVALLARQARGNQLSLPLLKVVLRVWQAGSEALLHGDGDGRGLARLRRYPH